MSCPTLYIHLTIITELAKRALHECLRVTTMSRNMKLLRNIHNVSYVLSTHAIRDKVSVRVCVCVCVCGCVCVCVCVRVRVVPCCTHASMAIGSFWSGLRLQ